MDDPSPSVRITRGTPFFVKVVDNSPSFSIRLTKNLGSMQDLWQKLNKFKLKNLSKKKNDPIEIWKVINIVKASVIKIVEGGSMRKILNSDSEDIESASSDLEKPEEHQVLA
ncbi:hypothetical protein KY284_001156 [Solanum tuberosum]|nr:hypothetical protein KY284_001156 [Solanum tuberosum]